MLLTTAAAAQEPQDAAFLIRVGGAALGTDLLAGVDVLVRALLFLRGLPALGLEQVDHGAHVFDLGFDQALQEGLQALQFSVLRVLQPGDDLETVSGLPLKVLLDVVDDEGLAEVAPEQEQVLNVYAVVVLGVLPVEAVLDVVVGGVQHVQDPVCVVLGGCCEDHYFIDSTKILEECDTIRPNFELPLFSLEMHQRFIQIKHQRILKLRIHFWQYKVFPGLHR